MGFNSGFKGLNKESVWRNCTRIFSLCVVRCNLLGTFVYETKLLWGRICLAVRGCWVHEHKDCTGDQIWLKCTGHCGAHPSCLLFFSILTGTCKCLPLSFLPLSFFQQWIIGSYDADGFTRRRLKRLPHRTQQNRSKKEVLLQFWSFLRESLCFMLLTFKNRASYI